MFCFPSRSVFFMLFSNDYIQFDMSYTAICVEKCPQDVPSMNSTQEVFDSYEKYMEIGQQYCQYDQQPKDIDEYLELVKAHKCPSILYNRLYA